MTHYRIGLDLDGVLVDFFSDFTRLLCHIEGISPPPNFSPSKWDWYDELGVSKQTVREAWNRVAEDPTFWEFLPPMPTFAQDRALINRLEAEGHDIYFITHRPFKGAKQASAFWLKDNTTLDSPTVLISSSKGSAARALALDFFLDDKPENCHDVLTQRGVRTTVYLYEASYNQTFQDPFIQKAKSFTEAWEHFLKHRSEGY